MTRVFVGIGSNIDREANVRAGVEELQSHYGELRLSSVYETAAVGFAGEPFYNLVASFETAETVLGWILDKKYDDGAFWTGVTFPDRQIYTLERTTWTGAAILLASDLLYGLTSASQLFSHDFWKPFPFSSRPHMSYSHAPYTTTGQAAAQSRTYEKDYD